MQIVFEFDYKGVSFKDALVLPDDHTFTDVELEAMKQERFDNWVKAITAPAPEYMRDKNGNVVYDEDGNPVPAE